jgi:hypothetical protein
LCTSNTLPTFLLVNVTFSCSSQMSETQVKSPAKGVAFEVEVKPTTPSKRKTPVQTRLESPRPRATPEQIKQRHAEAQQRRASYEQSIVSKARGEVEHAKQIAQAKRNRDKENTPQNTPQK